MMANTCHWCGQDCTFLATCEGLCVPCGDKMQAVPLPELIAALARAVGEAKRLRAENERLKAGAG